MTDTCLKQWNSAWFLVICAHEDVTLVFKNLKKTCIF